MGGGEQASTSTSKPLTAAERQDLYRGAIGNILNTYGQSGLPYGGVGSMTPNGSTPAVYQASGVQPHQVSAWSQPIQSQNVQSPTTTGTAVQPVSNGLYNATGNASADNPQGNVNWFSAPFNSTGNPMDVKLPTGAPDPGGVNFPVYQTPNYQSPGAYQIFDPNSPTYANVLKGYTDPLDAAKAKDIQNYNNSAAERGIWSSGLALQGENDISKAYAPQYSAAGGAATQTQLGQLAGENVYNQAAANSANTFNQTNSQNQFSTSWAPLNYLSSLWAGTAGNVGGTSSFGANFSI